jgi:hypothetical protein
MDPNDKTSFEMKKKPYQFLTTVKDNMKFLSKRQQERAKKARELLEVMGTPTVDDLKAMIRMDLIKNNVVTTEAVNLATKAYGPDISGIKGKTTRQKPTTVKSNTVKIPEELLEIQQDLKVSMEGMTVNSMKFLTAISHDPVLQDSTIRHESRDIRIQSVYERVGDSLQERWIQHHRHSLR